MWCFDLSMHYWRSQSNCRVQHLLSFTLKTQALNKSTTSALPPSTPFLPFFSCMYTCVHVEAQLLSLRLLIYEAGLVVSLELAR